MLYKSDFPVRSSLLKPGWYWAYRERTDTWCPFEIIQKNWHPYLRGYMCPGIGSCTCADNWRLHGWKFYKARLPVIRTKKR